MFALDQSLQSDDQADDDDPQPMPVDEGSDDDDMAPPPSRAQVCPMIYT